MQTNKLYPLVFKPIYKEKIWGGNNFKQFPGMVDAPDKKKLGEAWLMSGLNDNPTYVANGFLKNNPLNELVEIYMDDIVGEKVYTRFENHFPVLLKFIDATDKLSIQVHPDDEMAEKLYGYPNGKTEMWYILNADKDSWIINGFNRDVSKEECIEFIKNDKIEEILNYIKVEKDEAYLIPAGRIHAAGKGIVFAEVQQASDYTFRIYDWNRTDEKNNKRKLHINEAILSMNLKTPLNTKINYNINTNTTLPLVKSQAFYSNLIVLNKAVKRDFSGMGTFVAYLCLEGSANICYDNIKVDFISGNAVLVPAEITENEFFISTDKTAKLIEIYLNI